MKYLTSNDEGSVDKEKVKIALVYHFFAEYRRPVLETLLEDPRFDLDFFGDSRNQSMPGLPVWGPGLEDRGFRAAKCHFFPLGFLWQRRVVTATLRGDYECFIFLGDWKFLSTWVAAFVARLRGRRVLFWTQGWRHEESGFLAGVRVLFYRIANGLLLYGPSAKQIGISKGFDASRLYLMMNSLDYKRHVELIESSSAEAIRSRREKWFPDVERPVLVCAARLQKSKRMDLLIEAAYELAVQGDPVNVLVIGDGPELPDLKTRWETARRRWTESGRIESDASVVVFAGACFDVDEVAFDTMAADLTVCPSSAGLTVIQSLTFGVPVVTCDDPVRRGPEVDAIEHGETGYFFETDCVASLVRIIRGHLQKDPIEVQRMKDACRKMVDDCYNPEYQAGVVDLAVRGGPAPA